MKTNVFLIKLLFCFPIFLFATDVPSEEIKPKVAVIGAGIAGLTAAYRLHQADIDVHVYEARGRVGGRILTAIVNDQIVELGGHNICDGGAADNLHRLIDEFGIEITKTRGSINNNYFTGDELISVRKLLDPKEFDPVILKTQLADIASRSSNMLGCLKEFFHGEDLLYKIFATRLSGYEGGTVEKLSSFYVRTFYHQLLGGICAVHQSGDFEDYSLNFMRIKGGNSLLPQKLAQHLDQRVHLNMALAKVSKDSGGSYVLSFKDGQMVKADVLVLAIPCSVYSDISFDPEIISEERYETIKNIQYGTTAKILVPFASSPENPVQLISDRSLAFLDSRKNVLTLYYVGEASRFSEETIANTYLQDRPMIEMGYPTICPPFSNPIFAQDIPFAVYDGPVGYSWPNDPYVKGSYSYISQGQEEALLNTVQEDGEEVKALFAPIDQTLYFAGEHATIFIDILGTMEAGCESGERVARMIQKAVGSKRP